MMRYLTVTDLEKREETRDKGPGTRDLKKGKGLSGAELGNLVHAALKEMTMDIKTHALNLSLRVTEEELKEVSKLLSKFLNSPLAPPTWEGEHELPFRLKCGPAVITGIIDYVYETDKGFVICDFKTDLHFHPEKYKLQMDIYALALSKASIKPVLETRLLFLKLNKVHVEVCNAERFRQTEEKIDDQHHRISGGKDS